MFSPPFCAHDFGVLAQGCSRHALPNPVLAEDCLDLAAAYKQMKGDKNTTGLKKAAEELGVAADGYWHTAYDDAVNTSKILLKLIDDGWIPEDYFAFSKRSEHQNIIRQ